MNFRLIILCAFLNHGSLYTYSQTDYNFIPDVTDVIFINDAYLVGDMNNAEGINDVLIKKGVISAISKFIEAPYNARVIEADSAFLYPSFIDGLSHTGNKAEKKNTEIRKVKFPGHPPNDVAGIQPDRSSYDIFNPDNGTIKDLRENGFAISHTVAHGNMLPGQGSIILLNGSKSESNLLVKDISQYFQFTGVRGYYPSTTIAVIAKWKELLRQTAYYDIHQKKFVTEPLGTERISHNKIYESLIPVIEKRKKVFMKTEKIKSIYQALQLEKEFGYNLVLSDVKQGWEAIEKITNTQVQVLLSLELPDEKTNQKSPATVDSISFKKLSARKMESQKAYNEQAYQFDQAGIPFAFCMLSAKTSDIKKNLIKMVETGVSRNTLLNALTLNAAKILNIDSYTGSLEVGKMANMFLCNKDFFEKDSHIKMNIIGGMIFEFPKKEDSKTKSDLKELSDVVGEWSFSVNVEGEIQTGKILISDDPTPSVNIITDEEPTIINEAKDISFDNSILSFSVEINEEGVSYPVKMRLSFEETEFDGSAEIEGLGSYTITGQKTSSPE